MNEVTAAVVLAQLDKLEDICAKRNAYGDKITEALKEIPGIYPHKVLDDCKCTYWFYKCRINEEELGVSRSEFVKALSAEGICEYQGYIPFCIYHEDMFENKTVYPGNTQYPFDGCTAGKLNIKTVIVLLQKKF